MEQKMSYVLRLAGVVFGATLLVSLIVLIVGLTLHWNTPVQFSNGFFIAGGIVIVLGIVSGMGGLEQRGDAALLYGETAGHASITERTQQMLTDSKQRYGMLILAITVGALLIVIAVIIS